MNDHGVQNKIADDEPTLSCIELRNLRGGADIRGATERSGGRGLSMSRYEPMLPFAYGLHPHVPQQKTHQPLQQQMLL